MVARAAQQLDTDTDSTAAVVVGGVEAAEEFPVVEAVTVTYINRVWDSSAGSLVRWNSAGSPDTTGTSYPGPGTFGVDTSDYCVEDIT